MIAGASLFFNEGFRCYYIMKFSSCLSYIVAVGFVMGGLFSTQPIRAASGPGDVVGKVSVGYQGWFACSGDGSPMNDWFHWSSTWSQPPSPSNFSCPAWPDVRDYAKTYQTAYANLNNGQSATLFSSCDQQVVNTQVLWMQQNGIDTIALQRFGGANTDAEAPLVRAAAEAYGRKFYLMYDMNGFNTVAAFQNDWNSKGAAFTSSPAYAKQNGKPVVCIWGIGMGYMTQAQDLQIINWFKSQNCYVIGGVTWSWYSDTANISSYNALNMISPWMVGVVGNIAGANNLYTYYLVPEEAYCNSHGIDYQPCVLPGDMSQNQRIHGDLMWDMFYNAVHAGCQGIYVSMFDEYGEGNQIAKTTTDSSMIPSNSSFLSLNADGTWCTSDYYLRLTGDGGRMLKGQIGLTSTRPTQPNPSQTIANGTYKIISRNSGLALDDYGQLTADGSNVDQWGYDGGPNQRWSVTCMGNNQYQITGVQSVKALEVYGNSTADGGNVDIWSINGGSNQLWTINATSGGYYNIVNVNSGMLLDVSGGSTADGANVDQWAYTGGANQQWAFQTP